MASALKEKLYDLCKHIAQSKIETLSNAISSSQNAANSETKSTAGDKHDTARAMMQLEVEQKSKQLAEAKKLLQTLAQFGPTNGSKTVALGSLVITKTAKYYISVSVGKLDLEEQLYFAVSPISPVAQAMMGKNSGDSFEMNGRQFEIESVL